MARAKYVTVKIPAELAEVLDECRLSFGYRSRAEIVDDAVRMFVVRMKTIRRQDREARATGAGADRDLQLRPMMTDAPRPTA